MLDLSNVRVEDSQNHLFIPMAAMIEVDWLLKHSESGSSEYHIRSWRKVVKNQVPAIKHISEAERNAEIDSIYGDEAKYVKRTPAVIISHYNTEDLLNALNNTLFGDGDEDYKAYDAKLQESALTEEEIDTMDI